MEDDIGTRFMTATSEERLRLVRDGYQGAALKRHLGEEAYEEYSKLANRVSRKLDVDHLGVRAPKNLVFVPGIMGSLLQSQTKGGIWWIDARTRHHINDLRLSPDGLADANADDQIIPCCVDTSYEPFQTAILEREDLGHVAFPYDWRKTFDSNASLLKEQVVQLYENNGNRPVHLVAHSMGGLLVRATLMNHGQELWPKLGRLVFIGTPHYGSPAIAGYLKNHLWGFELMALLGIYLGRETFRSLWGALSMLPAPRGVYPGTRPSDPEPWSSDSSGDWYDHPCANFDMYRAENWKLDLTSEQESQLQTILTGAAEFHARLYRAHQELRQELRNRMLVIAGVGYKTLFRLSYETRFFGRWEHTAKVTSRVEGDRHREGDGRVPLASAELENVTKRYVRAVHGGLPNVREVYEDVFSWLGGESMNLPTSARAALGAHLAPGAGKSDAPHLDGTAEASPYSDDPGYWEPEEPAKERINILQDELERQEVPAFDRVRLL